MNDKSTRESTPSDSDKARELEELASTLKKAQSLDDDKLYISTCEKMADLGDVEAMRLLGKSYLFGYGVKPNVRKGIKLLERAASAGSSIAFDDLGFYYFNYMDFEDEDDEEKAVSFLKKHAKQGKPEALAALGLLYVVGVGVSRDMDDARDSLEEAAKQNVSRAHYMLGVMHTQAPFGEDDVDVPKGIEHFERAMELGDLKGALGLAELYEFGAPDLECDYYKAMKYYSAVLDDWEMAKEAAIHLGDIMFKVILERRPSTKPWESPEMKRCYDYLVKSANNGVPNSMFQLAKIELLKMGDPVARENALELIRKAADKKHPIASFYHAMLLIRQSDAKSREKGKKLIDKLADEDYEGTISAMRMFSSYEYHGTDEDTDEVEMEYYDPDASFEMGFIDIVLLGDELLEKGIRHLELAVEMEHELAKTALESRFWEA